MKNKYVHMIMPTNEDLMIDVSVTKIPNEEKTIYDAIGFFEDEIFLKSKLNFSRKIVKEKILLKNLINLHDSDGLDLNKIISLKSSICKNNHIFSDSSLPNVKIVKTFNNNWVVFDGHHTINAYMLNEKKFLDEIPHLIVETDSIYFCEESINLFYGKHAKKLKGKNWSNYVINWNEINENQLCLRKNKNFGELFESLKNHPIIKNNLI
jgi:hypothetical protein